MIRLLESLTVRFMLTVAVAVASGLIAVRLKVPTGALVGGMFGVAVFNIITSLAYAPALLRMFTQSLAGAYIGIRIHKSDLPQFRIILLPAAIMIVSLLGFNIGLGFTISGFTDMTLVTALLSTAPGGITEISLMSADMGANQAQVTLMHLLRLTSVLGFFPFMLKAMIARFGNTAEGTGANGGADSGEEAVKKSLPATLATAIGGGVLGQLSGLPSGALAFAMVAVATLNIQTGRADIPVKYRKYVQILAGLIIGKGVSLGDILQIPDIILPAILMVLSYFAINILLSAVISKCTRMDFITALFCTSPAGASDMALMAMDLGGDAPKVACMQMARMLSVVIIFPAAIQAVVGLLGG